MSERKGLWSELFAHLMRPSRNELERMIRESEDELREVQERLQRLRELHRNYDQLDLRDEDGERFSDTRPVDTKSAPGAHNAYR